MTAQTPELKAAYAACRAIAKREAKNFYYGFLALPSAKRDAMCAVYAFMRRADDISDDESLTLDTRRDMMRQWLQSWHSGQQVAPQDRAMFLAVHDVQARFHVEDHLLDQLVEGTTMDLDPATPAGVTHLTLGDRTVDQYDTAAALERYCYLVASVVGLVTIRIFGCNGPAADAHAEQMGHAFQITNILRDVREDAERGRIYLPTSLLQRHGLTSADVLACADAAKTTPAMQAALRDLSTHAENLYTAANHLIPMLAVDSRAAMRILVRTYHLLLREIAAQHYRVFESRIRVSSARKVCVLVRGFLIRGNRA